MNKEIDFKMARDKLDGRVTPEALRENVNRWVDGNEDEYDIKDMVVIYTYSEPDSDDITMRLGFTNMDMLRLAGLLDWAKLNVQQAEGVEDL